MGVIGVAPAQHLDPFAGFEILVVLEEVLDLLQRDLGQIAVVLYLVVALREFRRWHRDDLFVATGFVFHQEYADRPPHHLSFGQRRRVAIATVLAMRPEILVLDEPSSNLDPASRRELAQILRSIDVTILMVTHDLPYALELCERSVVLSEGVIAADGPTRTVLADSDLMARHRLELPFGFAF